MATAWFLSASVGAGVEEFLGQDPVVALYLAVMPGCVGPDPLMDDVFGSKALGELAAGVTRAVVSDPPADVGDAVGSEERFRVAPEPEQGVGGLVREGFGVGESGEPVDRRVEVGVADLAAFGDVAAAVEAPTPALGDPADLLHVQVDHVTAVAGSDRARFA